MQLKKISLWLSRVKQNLLRVVIILQGWVIEVKLHWMWVQMLQIQILTNRSLLLLFGPWIPGPILGVGLTKSHVIPVLILKLLLLQILLFLQVLLLPHILTSQILLLNMFWFLWLLYRSSPWLSKAKKRKRCSIPHRQLRYKILNWWSSS